MNSQMLFAGLIGLIYTSIVAYYAFKSIKSKI